MCKTNKLIVNTVERNMVINGTHVHITSVFKDTIPLEKALANIAKRKLNKSNNKF